MIKFNETSVETTETTDTKHYNYYTLINEKLKLQYPSLEGRERNAICREVIFAPTDYMVTFSNHVVLPITKIRKDLADCLERESASKNFIPYSLDAEIANLIESSNCETSSVNEYYRWISLTTEILQNAADGKICKHDIRMRNSFIEMSREREVEILLCLALYQESNAPENQEKIDLLRFKLARLREMRRIVESTPSRPNMRYIANRKRWIEFLEYVKTLPKEKIDINSIFNLKLNINIDHSEEEDLEEGFSYMDFLKKIILSMMRRFDNAFFEKESRPVSEKKKGFENDYAYDKPVKAKSKSEADEYIMDGTEILLKYSRTEQKQ